jgi:hypothetical protein
MAGKASQRLNNDQFRELLIKYSRTKKVIENAEVELKNLIGGHKKSLAVVTKTISSHMTSEGIDDAVKLPDQVGTIQMVTKETTPKLSVAVKSAIEAAMEGFVAPDSQVEFMSVIKDRLEEGTTRKSSLKFNPVK